MKNPITKILITKTHQIQLTPFVNTLTDYCNMNKSIIMLLIRFCLYVILFSLISGVFSLLHAQTSHIRKLNDGEFQICFPEQTTNVYFHHRPSGTLGDGLSGVILDEEKKYEHLEDIREFMEDLPETIRSKYLGIELFLLHIPSETNFGYYNQSRIVVEIMESKLESGNYQDIKPILGHEVAHHIYYRVERLPETTRFIEYLNSQRNGVSVLHREENLHKMGFADRYSYDGFGRGYRASEEFVVILDLFLRNDPILYEFSDPGLYPEFAGKLELFNIYLNKVEPHIARLSSNEAKHFTDSQIEVQLKETIKSEISSIESDVSGRDYRKYQEKYRKRTIQDYR